VSDVLQVTAAGVLHAAEPGGARAAAGFASVAVLGDREELLATYTVGSGKDTDDITLEQRRSHDGGRTWSAPTTPFDSTVAGRRGSLEIGYVTTLPDRLVCAVMWVDREAFPGAPLFNPQTEGCLPMRVLVTESFDAGRSWSPLRLVPTAADVGPASLTCPVLALADGRLALSIETNKDYLDASPWHQRVVYLWSSDLGRTWSESVTVCGDPAGRLANWDQRTAVAADGRLVSFSWIYDFALASFRNVGRRISADGGQTWSAPEDLGFADQASVPAMLPDGRVVLAWVDRFGTASIRARCAASLDAPFPQASETVVYEHRHAAPRAATPDDASAAGELLADMYVWTYGGPFALALPDGDVLVTYYQGDPEAIGIRWARLSVGG
jgi:hypothetical protein